MARNNSIEMLKKRLMAEFARDKKKAVILIVLLLVAVFFVGKLLLKSTPVEATAATNPMAAGSSDAPMSPETGNIAAQVFAVKSSKADVPKSAANMITRDIFMPNESIFPHVEKTTAANSNSKVKVIEDEKTKRDAELKRKKELIRAQGAELHLESTITGRVPIAIINGTVLGPDGVLNGFRVVKIDSQACVVEKEGVRLNLTME